MMTTAMGTLGWTPQAFWRATMMDFTTALKGHLAAKGVDLKPGVSREEFAELVEQDRLRMEAVESGDNA